MTKKLTHNLGLKILSVLVSIILWLVAININDPVRTQTYSVAVQLDNLNKLTDSGKHVEVLDSSDSIRVTVKAARSVLAELSDRNIIAVANVDKMTEGQYVPIELTCSKGGVSDDNLKSDKDYVRLSVENIKRRQLPISVVVQGTPQEDFIVGGTSTAQNAVMLSGPESIIDTVNSVSVEIDVNNASGDVNISLPIHLYDSEGEEVTDYRIEKSISDVSTTASILEVRTLPVEYLYVGAPEDGYAVDGRINADITSVTVAGKTSAYKNVQRIEVTEALDVTGATRLVEDTVDLKKWLPDGLSFAEAGTNTKAKVSLKVIRVVTEEDEEASNEEE